MINPRKQRIRALLKAIETGDEKATNVVSPAKYIQHNPQTEEGGEGLAELFKRLSKTSPRVNIVRIFSDGDYVFAHTEYDFSQSRVGFEVFRFEGDMAVEHWDNIQTRMGPNPSGHSMVDGAVTISDISKTKANKKIVKRFTKHILVNRETSRLPEFVSESYIEHNPSLTDGRASLYKVLKQKDKSASHKIEYQKCHHLLAEGNFVLSVCEGYKNGSHTSFYDLYRIETKKIVEHWDTTETIPPASEWKNDNGKF